MKSESSKDSSVFQHFMPSSMVEFQLWIIVSIPVVTLIITHYVFIMCKKLWRSICRKVWGSQPPPPPPFPANLFPDVPPGNKNQAGKKDIQKVKMDMERVTNRLQAQLVEVEKEAQKFTRYVNSRQEIRYDNLVQQHEQDNDEIKQIIEEFRQHVEEKLSKVVEDLRVIEDFANGVENVLSGEFIPRPFISKIVEKVVVKLASLPPPPQLSLTSDEVKSDPSGCWNPNVASTPIQLPAPVMYSTPASLPPPRFDPNLNTAEAFLEELNHYMNQRHIPERERISHLQNVFGNTKDLNLWWQRTKLQVENWNEFQDHFMRMFGSVADLNSAKEKLLQRRQNKNEKFSTFAMEMELHYLKLHRDHDKRNTKIVLDFIAERALPQLKPHLLACNAMDIYELIQFAQKIEANVVYSSNSYWNRPSFNKPKEHSEAVPGGLATSHPTIQNSNKAAGNGVQKNKSFHRANVTCAGEHNPPLDVEDEGVYMSGSEEEKVSPTPIQCMNSFYALNVNSNSNQLPIIPMRIRVVDRVSKRVGLVEGDCLIDCGAGLNC